MDGKKHPPDRLDSQPHPDAPPSEEELTASARLRDALEDPSQALGQNPDADLARALALAHAPRDIDPQEHKAIVERAIVEGTRRAKKANTQQRGVVIRVTFAMGAIVAVAASILLFFNMRVPAPAVLELAVTRSTQSLFPERFPQVGGESARIDRIAMARSADLRENRFARWGVR